MNADILTTTGGGKLSDFNHTGRRPVNGYWDSDHAGLVSVLRLG
jgi:hypothetical protein